MLYHYNISYWRVLLVTQDVLGNYLAFEIKSEIRIEILFMSRMVAMCSCVNLYWCDKPLKHCYITNNLRS